MSRDAFESVKTIQPTPPWWRAWIATWDASRKSSTRIGDNTVVIFTSDNGGLSTAEGHPTSNLPLRGGKGWVYEGGIREPFIIKAPGTASGSVSAFPASARATLLTLIR